MDDIISRQAAIDAVEAITWYHQNRNNEMVSGANSEEDQPWYKADDIYAALNNVPSAQPEPQWIPCSERLPEYNQICIVTDETRRYTYEYDFHDETYDEESGWTYMGHKIIAWMPLPEPYCGARMEENDDDHD